MKEGALAVVTASNVVLFSEPVTEVTEEEHAFIGELHQNDVVFVIDIGPCTDATNFAGDPWYIMCYVISRFGLGWVVHDFLSEVE